MQTSADKPTTEPLPRHPLAAPGGPPLPGRERSRLQAGVRVESVHSASCHHLSRTPDPDIRAATVRERIPLTLAESDAEIRRAAETLLRDARRKCQVATAMLASFIFDYERQLDRDDAAGAARAVLSCAMADLSGIAFKTAQDRLAVLTTAVGSLIAKHRKELAREDVDHAINAIRQAAEFYLPPGSRPDSVRSCDAKSDLRAGVCQCPGSRIPDPGPRAPDPGPRSEDPGLGALDYSPPPLIRLGPGGDYVRDYPSPSQGEVPPSGGGEGTSNCRRRSGDPASPHALDVTA